MVLLRLIVFVVEEVGARLAAVGHQEDEGNALEIEQAAPEAELWMDQLFATPAGPEAYWKAARPSPRETLRWWSVWAVALLLIDVDPSA